MKKIMQAPNNKFAQQVSQVRKPEHYFASQQ